MKTTAQYVKRKPRAHERQRLEDAVRIWQDAKRRLTVLDTFGDVEIRLTNRTNPNGFVLRSAQRWDRKTGKPVPLVCRFITLGWARRNGYIDCQPRRRRKRL